MTQPVAVYLQWWVLGTLICGYAFSFPLAAGAEMLAALLPGGAPLAGAAAVGALLLSIIERGKRNRAPVCFFLLALASLLMLLALWAPSLTRTPATSGWALLAAVEAYGVLHLLWLEDWASGRGGAGFRCFAVALRDLATLRWWAWSSKSALRQRADWRAWKLQLRAHREQERVDRLGAEDRAARQQAERRAAEQTLARREAQVQAARAEKDGIEAQRRAAEAAALSAKAEQELLQVQEAQARSLQRCLLAEREVARLRTDYLRAARLLLESAVATKAAAEAAARCDVERSLAEHLLDHAQAEIGSEQVSGTGERSKRNAPRSADGPEPVTRLSVELEPPEHSPEPFHPDPGSGSEWPQPTPIRQKP